jgi:hypothetical protein
MDEGKFDTLKELKASLQDLRHTFCDLSEINNANMKPCLYQDSNAHIATIIWERCAFLLTSVSEEKLSTMVSVFGSECGNFDEIEDQIISCCASMRNELRDLLLKRKEGLLRNARLVARVGHLSFVSKLVLLRDNLS